jgi:hypothetical protein
MIWNFITIVLLSIAFIALMLYAFGAFFDKDILYNIGLYIIFAVFTMIALMLIIYLVISTFGIKI